MKLMMILKNFVGIFQSNYVTKFISFHEMIEKNLHPSKIMNTDHSNKKGTHWWSFLNLHERKIFLFDSFGFEGSKEFIIDDDRNILHKILFGIEKLKKKDNVTSITLKFSMIQYEEIKLKRIHVECFSSISTLIYSCHLKTVR